MSLPFGPDQLEFENREGDRAYAFTLPRKIDTPGMSAMVRARNEGRKIEHCLRSILPVFDDIHVIDNGSTDDTADIVRRVQDSWDTQGKIRLHSYPFSIRRFGPEHGGTPADSLHSLVYFTNWSMSRCTRRYVCKWDGDMVLVRENREAFAMLLERLARRRVAAWSIAGQTVYRDLDGRFFEAIGEVNREVEIFPCTYHCRFHKADNWEQLIRPRWLRTYHYPPVVFYELKFLEENEFDHWSTTEFPSERKRREWENFHRLSEGRVHGAFRPLSATFLDDQVDGSSAAVPATSRRSERDDRPSRGLRRLMPHFLGIGAMRAGTTWLATQLAAHPEIRMGRKEIHFFDRKLGSMGAPGSVRDRIDQLRYVARFARAPRRGRIRGEITPSYAILERSVIERIAEWMPHAKLVFLLRDPIERAWSQAQNDFPNWRGTDLRDVSREQLIDFFRTDVVRHKSDYARCLRAWMSVFPHDRFFFAFLDDIRAHPTEVVRDTLAFLGASTMLPPGVDLDRVVGESAQVDMPDWLRDFLTREYAFDADEVSELIGREVPWAR